MAPQVDYTTAVLGPLLARFGVNFRLEVARRGYYPRGGGEVTATAPPLLSTQPMLPIELVERGEVVRIDGYCFVGGQRASLAEAKEAAEEARSLLKECYPAAGVTINLLTVLEERVGNNGSGSGVV